MDKCKCTIDSTRRIHPKMSNYSFNHIRESAKPFHCYDRFCQYRLYGCACVCVCAHARVSESILPHCVYSSGIARSSITDPSSFPNTGGLHLCETLTHAVIAATGLHWYYRLNNCQITMAASGPELTPCP